MSDLGTVMDAAGNQFGLFFDAVSVALCAVDGHGNIVRINRTLRRMLGWDPAACQGQPLADCLRTAIPDPAQALSWHVALSQAVALGRTTRLDAPTRFRIAAGQEGLDNVTGLAIALIPGAAVSAGAVLVIYGPEVMASTADVHARLLSAMAHELSLPASNVAAAAALLAEISGSRDGREKHLLGIVQDEAARLQRLIAGLLTDPPLPEGPPAPVRDVVALRPILRRVSRVLGLHRDRQDISLQVPPDPPFVWGDTVAIQQILGNLVDNALQRHAGPTPLQLGVETTPDEVRLCLVEPGAQASCRESPAAVRPRPPASGSLAIHSPDGLGLSVAASLVEAMGGRLWYTESGPGQRCTCFALRRASGGPEQHPRGEA